MPHSSRPGHVLLRSLQRGLQLTSANPEKYAIVADILRGDDRSGCMSVMDRAADVEDAFRDLLNDLDIATGLSNYGVKREDLPACADRAFARQAPPEQQPPRR